MDARRFDQEYELLGPLYDVAGNELRERDERQGRPERWFVSEGGEAIGAVTIRLRPDHRLFLGFRVTDLRAYAPLTAAVTAAHPRSVSTTVDESETERVGVLRRCGFDVEVVGERFRVRFSDALGVLQRAWIPSGYEIRSVADTEEARAFTLDNAIRDLVPGTDGWVGDAESFHQELNAPEFDPSAYLIAVDQATDEYVGLLRVWRNPDEPRLGMLGVLPGHRSQPLAAALLKQGLGAAATWGFDSFVTETSPSNHRVHPRLVRMGASREGRVLQMSRPWTGSSRVVGRGPETD